MQVVECIEYGEYCDSVCRCLQLQCLVVVDCVDADVQVDVATERVVGLDRRAWVGDECPNNWRSCGSIHSELYADIILMRIISNIIDRHGSKH